MRFPLSGSALATLFLTLVIAPPVEGQNGTLTGTVTDETGVPVVGARVRVTRSNIATESDAQGRYSLELAAGTYDVVVDALGYGGVRESNVSVSSGGTTVLDIDLVTEAMQLDPIVVTGDRSPIGAGERSIEQANSVIQVSGSEISERPTPKLTDHLLDVPGVDVIEHGLQATNFVVRGFNNIFSGALHMLSDYRLAGVPSLRVNLAHFIPTTSEDLERIEVVLGPGSALYGPNTANGVVHMISQSPLDEQGTTVTLSGGSKGQDYPSAFRGAFRSAFLLSDDVGVKISGQYMDGEEWPFVDPVEEAGRVAYLQDLDSIQDEGLPLTDVPCIQDRISRGLSAEGAQAACERVGARDFNIERYSVEARLDWRFGENDGLVATYGRNSSTGIELTGLGAGQTDGWISDFYQLRLTVDRFFAQTYLNQSNAGDSFLLRQGTILEDESRLMVGQVQHGFAIADGVQDFTYGFDYFATRPDSKGTIYGRFENEDEINEWGVYLQSKTAVSERVDLIGALRLDSHSVLQDDVWSPRAAIVFKPTEDHGIRFSYNRAFSTPTALNYFLDIPGGLAGGGYSLRAYGSGRDGWSLQDSNGMLRGMRSPFNPDAFGGPEQLLPADVPTIWPIAVGVLAAQQQIDPATAAFLLSLDPTNDDIARLASNPLTGQVTAVSELLIPDLEPTRESVTQTFELGWTGRINDRVQLVADVYYTRKNDFVSPLLLQTPLLSLDPTSTAAYLAPLIGPAQAAALAEGLALVPAGVVSSNSVGAVGPELIVSYRNVGEVDFWGGDLSFEARLTDEWWLNGMYSLVTKDEFKIEDGSPITLNAPKHKGSLGLRYRGYERGLTASGRVRYTSGFPASSVGFIGDVDDYAIVDVNAGYEIPNSRATLQFSVSNLFNTEHQSFIGVPPIGRFTMLGVRYDLF